LPEYEASSTLALDAPHPEELELGSPAGWSTGRPTAFLLTRDHGERWRSDDWDHLMREAVARAQLPKGVVLYSLRHAFISETLMSGMSTLTVARLVGTRLAMIERHYGHIAAKDAREQLAKVALL